MRPHRGSGAVAALAILAIVGCSPGNGGNETGGTHETGQAPAVELRPGLWDVSREIVSAEQPGLPPEMLARLRERRSTRRHCITPEQAARPESSFLTAAAQAQCSGREFTMAGGTISGSFRCRDGSGTETVARISGTYAAERFEYRTELQTPGVGGQTMRVVTLQTGRRIGQCAVSAGGETKR